MAFSSVAALGASEAGRSSSGWGGGLGCSSGGFGGGGGGFSTTTSTGISSTGGAGRGAKAEIKTIAKGMSRCSAAAAIRASVSPRRSAAVGDVGGAR